MVRVIVSALAIAAAALGAPMAHATCDDLLPREQAIGPARDITPLDLVRFRDVGEPDVYNSSTSPYAVSPDGRDLAFVIARADPSTNVVCTALVVMAVDGKGVPRIIDRGGRLPSLPGNYRGLFISSGFPDQITPIWSPDGRSIAYRKLVQGVVQLVRAAADGSGASVVTQAPVDIEDFAWTRDSRAIVYTARTSLIAAERAVDREGETGWLYDIRTIPNISWRPNPLVKDLPTSTFRVDVDTRVTRAASADEQVLVTPPPEPGYPYDVIAGASNGAKAWTEPVSASPLAEHQVRAADAAGRKFICDLAGCTGKISRIFWDRSGRSVLFLSREGWNHEETVLHRWVPGVRRLATLLSTTDSLTGCIQSEAELICGRENAATPRRIVAIDPRTGRDRLIYDPNPEFSRLRLGTVQRLRWTNDRGLPAWGDLVLPPGYDGKTKLPLIVVNYFSSGFLRGGTGDEYPIFVFAAKGFAVLSFERPPTVATMVPGLASWDDDLRALQHNWAERRSVHSALMTGIDKAIATGAIDPSRLGITGLSDGASIVEFALVNTRRFAAAAMSTCCDDRATSLVLGGEAWGDQNHRTGYPLSVDDDRDYWKPISLSLNARLIDTPILFQLADREAGLALQSYGALREAGKPVEMRIYPGEYHNKVQPLHRLAIYDRNIDWFDFWLRGYEDPAPEKRSQYGSWEQLRSAQEGRPGEPERLPILRGRK